MSKESSKQKEATLRQGIVSQIRAMKLLFGKNQGELWAIVLCSVFSALSPYVTIYLSAQIINELAGGRDPERLKVLVLWTLGASALLGIFAALLGRWKKREGEERNQQKEKLYAEKFLELDYADMDRQKTHDLFSQIRQYENWGDCGLEIIASTFERCINAAFKILGALVLSVSLFTKRVPDGSLSFLNSPLCFLGILVLLFAVTFLAPMFGNRAQMYWSKIGEEATFSNRLFSFYGFTVCHEQSRALDVRIYGQEELCKRYSEKYKGFGTKSKIAGYARGPMGLLRAVSASLSNVLTGIVYTIVCLKAWAGAFGVGSVTQYIGAITSLSGGISELIRSLGDMRANAAHLERVFAFFAIPNEMYQGSLTTEKRSDRQYEVEFRDVSFRYPGSEEYALRHVSMKFRVGSRLAVVGQNGSGKTTFIKLLCRLYDPTEGEILLNGINIRKYKYDDYMNIFSVVFQDFQLLALSLGENVAAGREYDRERASACLRDAGFGKRLAELPAGLDTVLYKELDQEGVTVSGGEAQKIAIARALYKDAPFIILDEPTAALDPVAEAEIYAGFDKIAGDKTAIYISHRLSSCRFCDEIAVFDEGRVIEQGSHEALVADEGGKYYELWNAQAQYYTE